MKYTLGFSLLIGLATALASSALAAERTPDIRSLMTTEDFSASGMDKLSEAERAHLSEWLVRYRRGILEGPAPPKTPEERAEERQIVIEASVIPEFQGWSGKTVFRLDNGQVWQQRLPGKMYYSGSESTVVIKTNLLGYYVLEHVATGRLIGVKRVR